MTLQEIRLELLRVSRPNLNSPDAAMWIETAKVLEAYILTAAGQLSAETPEGPSGSAPKSPDTISSVHEKPGRKPK